MTIILNTNFDSLPSNWDCADGISGTGWDSFENCYTNLENPSNPPPTKNGRLLSVWSDDGCQLECIYRRFWAN